MQERLTEQQLADLDTLAREATPEPWDVVAAKPGHDPDYGIYAAQVASHVLAECYAEFRRRGDYRPEEAKANAAFITAARRAVPRLVAELRAARAALDIAIWEEYGQNPRHCRFCMAFYPNHANDCRVGCALVGTEASGG